MISDKILNGINGNPNIPGDKSISHRAIIIPSISRGTSEIVNILKSEDVLHTLDAFRKMGVKIQEYENKLIIHGKGLNSLKKPKGEIYLGNSGTSARLLTGLLASQKFDTIIKGDNSLSKRPMERIINPLMKMEAEIQSSNGNMPLKIKGKNLKNKNLEITLPSAQIKSGLILASLNTHGETHITENKITRNHTELMLDYFGASINVSKKLNKKIIKIKGQKELLSKNISVPSDLSSSAFFIIAALINDNSHILLKNITILI